MLTYNFNLKNIRELDITLGIKITKTYNCLILSHEHYVEKFRYCDGKSVTTTYDASTHLKKNVEHSVDKLLYVQIIGYLI